MIVHEEAEHSAAPKSRYNLSLRMSGARESASLESIRGQRRSSDQVTGSVRKRWRASMTGAYVIAPHAANLMVRETWRAAGRSLIGLIHFNVGLSEQNRIQGDR